MQEQLSRSIKNNWSYIEEFDTSSNEDGSYSDVHDGEILKNILKQYENQELNILSLCLNFIQNFLPPRIRFQSHNIIVTGLLYTESEANLNFRDYLLPLVYEFSGMKENNLCVNINGQDYVFKAIISHCCVDLPAKSKIQETKQFGGYDACTYCEIPGEKVKIGRSNDGDKRKKGSRIQKKPVECVRYVEGDFEHPLRDEVETLKRMLIASGENDAVNGIKDVSCLVAFEHFNILHSISIEYMHCVLLGNQKRILNLFLDSKNKNLPYYIPPKKKKFLNNRIMAIKPNADVVRKPRSLEQKADFKASEYKFLLLYYLPVCLDGCIPKVFVEHIRALSAATYILLQTCIPSAEVLEAEIMLAKYVKQHQKLFGKENMVMNVHLLKHIPNSVRKLGPLWSHSAFSFERNNGVLLKMISGTTDVLLQIASKYCLKQSLAKPAKKSKEMSTVVESLLGKGEVIVEKSMRVLNIETSKELDLSNRDLCAYKRIKLGKVTYTSLLYTKPKKSIDYFVGLTNDMIGMVKFYIELDCKIYVVMDAFEIVDIIHHISKVQPTNQKIMAPIVNIKMKYIYMKVGLSQYITSPPNPFENE
ncbi:hypothetical protein HA402_001194 [Bradysia odoriphaga]|nr:hypothetical protein HA402_001194 [Bradysia odoriphaga]